MIITAFNVAGNTRISWLSKFMGAIMQGYSSQFPAKQLLIFYTFYQIN